MSVCRVPRWIRNHGKVFNFRFFLSTFAYFESKRLNWKIKKRITELIHKCHAMCNYWIVRFSQTSPAVVRALCDLCVRKTKMRHSDTCCTFVRSTDTRVVWMEASHHRPKQFRFLDFRVEMLFHSIILCFVLSIYTFFFLLLFLRLLYRSQTFCASYECRSLCFHLVFFCLILFVLLIVFARLLLFFSLFFRKLNSLQE